MISPDVAARAPGPVQSRGGAKPVEGPAPERDFEAFVEGEPAEDANAGAEAPDLIAILEQASPAAIPPTPTPTPAPTPEAVATALVAAATSTPAPPVPGDEVARPAGVERADEPGKTVVLAAPAAIAAPPPTQPPAAQTVAMPVAAPAVQGGEAPPAEAEDEADVEPETSVRIPGPTAVAGAPAGAAETRPIGAVTTPPAFDLALQPATAQSWKLSAVSAEAAQAAREPARAQSPPPRDVSGQIVVAIAQSTQPQFEIRLDPPELGRVQIRLIPSENGLQAVVLADRPETQDFLRRNADVLVRDLTEAGYAQVSLEFAAGGEAAPRDRRPEAQSLTATFEAAAPPPPLHQAPRPVAAGGLDIRL